MTTKTTILKWFFILPFLFVTINSCKKDQKEETAPTTTTPSTATMTADKQSVNQLEIVTMTSQDISLTQQSYTGTIGKQTVTLFVNQKQLGFQMPEIAAGSYSLQTTIEGKSFSVNFNVTALPAISNPDTYIKTAQASFEYTSTYLNTLATATANMYGAQDNNANVTILNNYAADLQNKINAASAQDKAILAKFIAANPILFSPLEDITQYVDSLNFNKTTAKYSDDEIKTMSRNISNRIINIGLLTVVGVSLQAYALASPEPVSKLLAVIGWGAVAFKTYQLNKYLICVLDKSLIQFGQIAIDNVSGKTASTYQFMKGTQYTIGLSSAYRNLSSQDVSSSSSIIASIVSSLNTYGTYWNKVMNFLPTSLIGGAFHIKNISTTKTKTWKVKPDYLTVKNISNSNVTVSVDNSSGVLKATFNTTQTTDQNFTFDVVYNNTDVVSSKSNFSGKVLIGDSIAWLTNNSAKTWSLYSMEIIGGTTEYYPSTYHTYYYQEYNINGTMQSKGLDPGTTELTFDFVWRLRLVDRNLCNKLNINNFERCSEIIEFSPTILKIKEGGTQIFTYKPK